jgi:hypothetical protein
MTDEMALDPGERASQAIHEKTTAEALQEWRAAEQALAASRVVDVSRTGGHRGCRARRYRGA